MIDVLLHPRCVRKLKRSLLAAGLNEIGGVLAAEQIGDGRFLVIDLSVQSNGTNSNFERDPTQHREFIRRFHDRVGHKPERYNYLGEWHSHPSYPATPSDADVHQMQQLVEDDEQQSTFLVLMIVKLDSDGELRGSAHGFRRNVAPVRGRLHGSEEEAIHEEWRSMIMILGERTWL
ncbi:Mov34/MPN/PAD-1 family protein [Variovorax sp. V116]|uniref:Mov34/MPN/PAD-1 family protein n=1 Tax=Variovorax sp. V116 TaxID=3065953 RepID=UPI0034E8BD72